MSMRMGAAVLAALLTGVALAQFPQPGGGPPGGFGGGDRGGDRGGFGRGGFGGPGGGNFDPSQFAGMAFDRASNGKPTITISEYTSRMDPEASKKLGEWASKKGITSGQVTRDQFSEFFKERMAERMSQGGGMSFRMSGGPGGGPPGSPTSGSDPGAQPGGGPTGPGGMDPEAFAKQRFEQYDTNKDGQLDPTEAEASSRLRESYKEVDTDRNGLISLAEYTQYIRMRFASGGPGGNPNDPNANPWGQPGFYVPVVPEQKKVAVYRFGSLPKDLPEWFSKIDADKDAQVGLYEWRKAGRDLAEFRSFDLNGDGFITVDEGLLPSKIAARKKDMMLDPNATASTGGKPGGDSSRMRGGPGGDRPDRGGFGRPDRGSFGRPDSGSSDRPSKPEKPDRGSFGKSDSSSSDRPSKSDRPEKPSKGDRMEMKKDRGGKN